jgi:hypothetical protein
VEAVDHRSRSLFKGFDSQIFYLESRLSLSFDSSSSNELLQDILRTHTTPESTATPARLGPISSSELLQRLLKKIAAGMVFNLSSG